LLGCWDGAVFQLAPHSVVPANSPAERRLLPHPRGAAITPGRTGPGAAITAGRVRPGQAAWFLSHCSGLDGARRPRWHLQALMAPQAWQRERGDGEEAGGRHGHRLYAWKSPQQQPPSPGINKMAAGLPNGGARPLGPGGEGSGAVPGPLRRAQ